MELSFEFNEEQASQTPPTITHDDLRKRADEYAEDTFADKTEADLQGTAFNTPEAFKNFSRANFYQMMGRHYHIVD